MKRFKLLSLLFLFQSCILIHTDDSVDLGGHYRYIQDPPAIIYNKGSEFKEEGAIIVGPKVKTFRFDNLYIIAESLDISDSTSATYWIINKNVGIDTATPTNDSIVFQKRLQELKINLKLD